MFRVPSGCNGKLFGEHLLFVAQALHFFEQAENEFQAFDVDAEPHADVFDISKPLNGFVIKAIISRADIV